MMRRFSRRMFGSLLLSTLAVPVVQAAQRVWDVIVVGAGGAGLSAAVSAAEAGAKVLVLEKMPHIGGNTRISGGFYACVDWVRQKRQGIEDSEQLFLSQMLESGGGHANPQLAAILVHNATPALKWLEKLGMRFQPTVSEAYGSRWPRSHKPLMPNGEGYIRTLSTAAVKLGVIIKTSTPVTTLLTDNDGRVCGVQIAENNIQKNIFSKRGVIVASGGFGANPAMIARYAPQFSGLTTNNMPGSTGEMLLAAQKAGAELVDMEDVLCNPGLPPGRVMRARFHMLVDQFILVDQTGRRFIREDASRAAVTRAILALPRKVAYTIIDSKGMKNLSILMQKEAVLAVESGDAWTADTIEDLARLMKLPAANLQATIDDYNTGMKTGQDPLGKVAPRGDFSLDHPPYWACFAGMSIHYTMGGIRINELAQALRTDGRPLAGLWAAGEATGGIHGKERLGGNGINDAVVFGRIAGQQAARDL
jgi:urocanate reductase